MNFRREEKPDSFLASSVVHGYPPCTALTAKEIGGKVKVQYVGLVQTQAAWWMTRSRAVYDAFDLPEGPIRSGILSYAREHGQLILLGPGSMDTAHASAAARRVFGEEVDPEQGLEGFVPHNQRGWDFLTGTGEFAREENPDD